MLEYEQSIESQTKLQLKLWMSKGSVVTPQSE
jgi:hypothetical protein